MPLRAAWRTGERGVMPEGALTVAALLLTMALVLPPLLRGHWSAALIRLACAATALAAFAALVALVNAFMQAKAEESRRGGLLRLAARGAWFVFFGALGGAAFLLAATFVLASPAVIAAASTLAGLACGTAGTAWLYRGSHE